MQISKSAKPVEGLAPKANGVGTRTGPVIDREALGRPYDACLHYQVGTPSGSPSSFTVDMKLQDSADGVTFADYAPPATAVQFATSIPQQTAAGSGRLDVKLLYSRRYLRVFESVSITGGSSPSVPTAASIVVGSTDVFPIP